MAILDTCMEGTMSQIFHLGPSFNFMKSTKMCFKNLPKVTRFLS